MPKVDRYTNMGQLQLAEGGGRISQVKYVPLHIFSDFSLTSSSNDREDDIFDVIIVSNFLHRPTFDSLLRSLNPNGLLFYQTLIKVSNIFKYSNRISTPWMITTSTIVKLDTHWKCFKFTGQGESRTWTI